ncbi:LysR substrate binding domain-containing protein [Streptomyces sp. cf386]|uniref:LysR substrate-binding domain-containing protein n=1 Tax=Streptomyces sp. cf386 TaxID=1761904 RepID=UPI0008800D94|nr:LysR substrate-binding domain-containing protein [Streptomyces sp. cf386]SDN22351.1 LysR substrate binding domain-containing protein [Streptomyces sp. cf386]
MPVACSTWRTGTQNRKDCSGKHKHHGLLVIALTEGRLLRASAAGPGAPPPIRRRPVPLRELATHSLAVPPPTTERGQAIVQACHQAGFTPTVRYVTADIAAQLTLARAALATALVPRTAIDPVAPGIRTAPVEDRPILRLLFAATRHTETANPTTTAVVAALRTVTRQDRTQRLRPA